MSVHYHTGYDAEAVQSAFEGEEQVWRCGVDSCNGSVGEYEVEGLDRVTGKSKLVSLPAVTTSERETTSTWPRNSSANDIDSASVQSREDIGPKLHLSVNTS